MADNSIKDDPLYLLLMKATPPNEHGKRTLAHLASCLNMSRWGVYKWVRSGTIPPDKVLRIVDLSGGRVTIADFERFVYNL